MLKEIIEEARDLERIETDNNKKNNIWYNRNKNANAVVKTNTECNYSIKKIINK
jgi:hypothetical protein